MDKVKLLSKNLSRLLRIKGITQAEMSRGTGFSASRLNNYLSGHSKPSLDDLFKLAEYFGVTPGALLDKDFSKGNLILNEDDADYEKKGKLKGNPMGNLMVHFDPQDQPPGVIPGQQPPAGQVIINKEIFKHLQSIAVHLQAILVIMNQNMGD